ncbi:MAG: hypothetical protein WBM83_15210 [Flavobacteriaceae bacterium]
MKLPINFIRIRFKHKVSLILIAFMLGISNVILEESRMVNDTRVKIELPEVLPDEGFNDDTTYETDF